MLLSPRGAYMRVLTCVQKKKGELSPSFFIGLYQNVPHLYNHSGNSGDEKADINDFIRMECLLTLFHVGALDPCDERNQPLPMTPGKKISLVWCKGVV